MTASPTGRTSASPDARFEIKSAQISLVALILKRADWALVSKDLLARFGPGAESAEFFDFDPVALDFSAIAADEPFTDLAPLLEAIRACRLTPAAVRAVPSAWLPDVAKLGLIDAPAQPYKPRPSPEKKADTVQPVPPVPPHQGQTMVLEKPVRSGQKVYARGGDLVVLAIVNQGAEIVADGNIHVYAPLRGKAMAGAKGNVNARIFSTCLEPELLAIAGIYRTSENALPANISGRPAQVRLSDDGQDKLIIEPLNT